MDAELLTKIKPHVSSKVKSFSAISNSSHKVFCAANLFDSFYINREIACREIGDETLEQNGQISMLQTQSRRALNKPSVIYLEYFLANVRKVSSLDISDFMIYLC